MLAWYKERPDGSYHSFHSSNGRMTFQNVCPCTYRLKKGKNLFFYYVKACWNILISNGALRLHNACHSGAGEGGFLKHTNSTLEHGSMWSVRSFYRPPSLPSSLPLFLPSFSCPLLPSLPSSFPSSLSLFLPPFLLPTNTHWASFYVLSIC